MSAKSITAIIVTTALAAGLTVSAAAAADRPLPNELHINSLVLKDRDALVGQMVYNKQGQKLGKVDRFVVGDDGYLYAVIDSQGNHDFELGPVAVKTSNFFIRNNRLVLSIYGHTPLLGGALYQTSGYENIDMLFPNA